MTAEPEPAVDLDRIREICLRALERRRRSRRELEILLQRKRISPETAAPVLDRLTEVGLVDDLAFARQFVTERQRSRPRGERALAVELRGRGIAADIIEEVLAETLEEESPVEAARRAVAGKLRSLSGKPPEETARKAQQFLLRRGFGYETVREALSGLASGGSEGDDSGHGS